MREYKETEIAGHEYVRCKGVQIINELGAPQRTILFHEESVEVTGSRHIAQPLGAVMNHLTADNGATEFDIIDFETMQPTGKKATYKDAYAIMASLYLHTAHKRDFEEAEMVRQAEEQRQLAYAEEQRLQQEAEQRAIEEQARQAEEAQKAAEEAAAAVAAAAEAQRALEESQRLEAERLAEEEAARKQAEEELRQASSAAMEQERLEQEAARQSEDAYAEGTGPDNAPGTGIAAP